GGVETTLDFPLPLRAQVRRSRGVADHRAGKPADFARGPDGRELLSIRWFVTGFAERRTDLELVHEARRLEEPVRRGRFGEVVQLAWVGVEAALIRANPGREKQSLILGRELLLRRETEVLDLLPPLGADHDVRPRVHVLLSSREVSARDARDVELAPAVLDAQGRGGGEGVAARRIRMDGAGVQIQVQAAAVGQE